MSVWREKRKYVRLIHAGDQELPIRFELFSNERLEQHAISLAKAQCVGVVKTSHLLIPRVHENTLILQNAYLAIAQAIGEKRAITPAAEWLLDNFHVIEAQVSDIGVDLPAHYYRQLPKLCEGVLAGYPRVYGIAWAMVAHTDSCFDSERLALFVQAYQSIQPLTLGELWAIPITLRVVLVENLRRLAIKIMRSQSGRRLADAYVDQVDQIIQDIKRSDTPIPSAELPSESLRQAFAVQLLLRSHDPHPNVVLSLKFMQDWLQEQNLSLDEIVHREHAAQIADNQTMRHIITSMRAISAFDWQAFVEQVSVVDQCLRQYPGYSNMDFLSRDRYRHALEELAKHSTFSELDIAQRVIDKSLNANTSCQQDPGYYLIGKGRYPFEREIRFTTSIPQNLLRKAMSHAGLAYISAISLFCLCLLGLVVYSGQQSGLNQLQLLFLACLALFPASDIAIGMLNQLIILGLPPRHLPRMAFKNGVPETLSTFVVVPTLLTSAGRIKQLLAQMEVRYLANPLGAVRFALLSDFPDADQPNRPEDEPLLQQVVSGVAELNQRYGEARFFVFHRQRLWNAAQGKWMGWERKRGKLHEFNRLLRGATDTSFMPTNGEAAHAPPGVCYVITLDDDTQLPMDVVSQLVGVAAHPLHQPQFDAASQSIVEGYGIIQPRITPTLPLRQDHSLFHQLFAGSSGIDAYSSSVSELYQDLFSLSTYSGKGLYHVDSFEAVLRQRVPDNTQLSHDLFESVYARCALVSDIEFYEDFPSHSQVAAAREHRWVRGDWQLLPWIFGPLGKGMPMLGRCKMLDNLRRSLSAPAAFTTLVVAWAMPDTPQFWLIGLVAATLALPAILTVSNSLIAPLGRGVSLYNHCRNHLQRLLWAIANSLIGLIMLAQQAWRMADAIAYTLIRLFITRKQLLKWITALQLKNSNGHSFKQLLGPLSNATLMVTCSGGLILLFNPAQIGNALPVLLLWWSAPLVARALSLPPRLDDDERLSASDTQQMRWYARRTWRFFSTFVTETEHFLPPDNFQEDPYPVIAQRSSPTNFGLYLLSVVAARDFGWLGLVSCIDRLHNTLSTLNSLPRLRGHFYNWYDTRSLQILEPGYVSTVDSGNLAGHLITLAQSCRTLLLQPICLQQALPGLLDGQQILLNTLNQLQDNRRTLTVPTEELRAKIGQFAKLLNNPAQTRQAHAWWLYWQQVSHSASNLLDLVRTFVAERDDGESHELLAWAILVNDDVNSHSQDLKQLMPWIAYADATGAPQLPRDIPLNELAAHYAEQMQILQALPHPPIRLIDALQHAQQQVSRLVQRLHQLTEWAESLQHDMDFRFLYVENRHLFALGYRVAEAKLDPSYYDLLASEARLTSLVAIAKRDIPNQHWFHLGRRLIRTGSCNVLLSWSGSMFEYLMPSLVTYTPRYSLLDHTCRHIIKRQIEYGTQSQVPWGISESAFNSRDLAMTYQYYAFGVPGLGMKRGLAEDLVITPYATALAAMYFPHAAIENFATLTQAGALGPYGFYEAVDYTPLRLAEGQKHAVVRCYMAHHQGMALLAFANVVYDGLFRHRFHQAPLIQSAELLLQERIPPSADSTPLHILQNTHSDKPAVQVAVRRTPVLQSQIPSCHWLSNGRYSVMMSAAGSGYSQWRDLAVTRWREEVTRDTWGSFLYLRDVEKGQLWSAGYQPTLVVADDYQATFVEDKIRIYRCDEDWQTTLEVLVSPEDNAEIRRISITHNDNQPRTLEITSYAEIVLAPLMADMAHPAFSNLFIHTEYQSQNRALIAHRRPRTSDDPEIWTAHVLSQRLLDNTIQYETDRARFIGRGQNLRRPIAMNDGRPLSNTVGAVLDPIFSLRSRVLVEAGATEHLTFTTLVADSRHMLEELISKYHNLAIWERVSALAWTHANVQLQHRGIKADEAQLFQKLANHVFYADPTLRFPVKNPTELQPPKSGLWRFGLSGDSLLVLLHVINPEDSSIVEQLLRAYEYWQSKGLNIDVVILNARQALYREDLQALLTNLMNEHQVRSGHQNKTQTGGLYLLRGDDMNTEERKLLHSAARVVLFSNRGTMAEQMARHPNGLSAFVPGQAPATVSQSQDALSVPELEFFNGLGGFADDGREYMIVLDKGQWTPAPWINVIANSQFGFTVSEAGSGFTWFGNSRENQLTPWSNDPVSDAPGEVLYLRDEDSGELWTPTALPIRVENASYLIRHGQGYSVFEHSSHGIHSSLQQWVSIDDPVKISALSLHNTSGRVRQLSVTAYVEWVLAANRSQSAVHIMTEHDNESGALFAYNSWNSEFGELIAFADLLGLQSSWTCHRSEFIGRNGSLEFPAGLMKQNTLQKRVGAGLDPCAVMSTRIQLQPGQRIEVVFLLGQANNREHARQLIQSYRQTSIADSLQAVKNNWQQLLSNVQVSTPSRELDIMLNHWLLYQTLSCRMWARAAFYQAGGAFGFRDQLQDCMALVLSRPDLSRQHILLAASRQFAEGDVQHWWHPPTGRGVRTHFSDDRIWLAYVVYHYVQVSGDDSILDVPIHFIDGPLLSAENDDAYFHPEPSTQSASLFEHCARALQVSLAVGGHGLALMGSGDWNDGMNRVGHLGKGESVWLSWFLISNLQQFAELAEARGLVDVAQGWRQHASQLLSAVEAEAWDGAWYRRAYFDDGSPLGSAANAECRIDAIAQSWSVLSGAADPERARRAMQSVRDYLLRHGDELALLFTPPFGKTERDPGYIKSYPPGIRENGGQYTHAALWSVMAYAELGDGEQAYELLHMLNPITRTTTRTGVYAYKVEPYVIAADIYSEPPHVRRGGWTWYTGAAGWFYRAGIESILGLQVTGSVLTLNPCIPAGWPHFSLKYRYQNTEYQIRVDNPQSVQTGVAYYELDGIRHSAKLPIQLLNDGQPHQLQVVLG